MSENLLVQNNENSITQNQVITVWGTSGSGKSSFAVQLALTLAGKKDLKILVADFNTLSPVLDHYFGISKEPAHMSYKINGAEDSLTNTGLNYAYDAIVRDIFEPKVLTEIVIQHPQFKNLSILTGNYLLNMFELLTEDHFEKIISAARKVFDIIILDVNSMFMVDATYSSMRNSNKIFFVTEADYTNLREANRLISYISSFVSKNKFEIIINKYSKKHLDKLTVSQIVEGQDLGGFIEYDDEYVKSKINKKPYILTCKKKFEVPFQKIAKDILEDKK